MEETEIMEEEMVNDGQVCYFSDQHDYYDMGVEWRTQPIWVLSTALIDYSTSREMFCRATYCHNKKAWLLMATYTTFHKHCILYYCNNRIVYHSSLWAFIYLLVPCLLLVSLVYYLCSTCWTCLAFSLASFTTTSEDTFTTVLYVKYVVLYVVIFVIKTWFSRTLICSNLLRFSFFNRVFFSPRYTSM